MTALPRPAVPATAQDIWSELAACARTQAVDEPLLARRIERLVLAPASPSEMLATVLASRLADADLDERSLRGLLAPLFASAAVLVTVERDLLAVLLRDAATADPLHVLLHLKGFQALVGHRAVHALYHAGRTALALALANRASAVFDIDIHPAARIGSGVMLDHGSGIVIGETSVVGDDVSILQGVTLGGTGKEGGDRHPKIADGVMIGAGAKVLGNIEVGRCAKIAAGSVVLRAVPAHCTVAGVPARVVRRHARDEIPALDMDQLAIDADRPIAPGIATMPVT